MRSLAASFVAFGLIAFAANPAAAQGAVGMPPPESKPLVAAPTAAVDVPKIDAPTHNTTATLSAGGQVATGNSELVAGSADGKFEMRRGTDGFGASLVGNYGQGAPGGGPTHVTAENLQGRLRYDRYVADRLSLFAMATGRHDRFQGLALRLNFDPGIKVLFTNDGATASWGEAGYDLQYDIRRDDARVPLNSDGSPNLGAPLLDKTATDHSARLFLGFKHAFNKEVTSVTGVEYLQSFVDSTRYRVNYDVLLAAAVGGGFSLGVGFSARYDHAPLPGKEKLDTVTTFNLIYALSDATEPEEAPTCPCPSAPPSPPPASGGAAAPPTSSAPVPPASRGLDPGAAP